MSQLDIAGTIPATTFAYSIERRARTVDHGSCVGCSYVNTHSFHFNLYWISFNESEHESEATHSFAWTPNHYTFPFILFLSYLL